MRKPLIILAVVAAIFLAVILAGCKSQGITGNGIGEGNSEKCIKQEAYTAQVPYNDTEYYYVEECLDRNGPYCRDVAYTDFTLTATYFSKTCYISIKNTGDLKGDWVIKAKFITTPAGGGPVSYPKTATLAPGESVKFEYHFDAKDIPSDKYVESDIPTGCVNVNEEIPVDKDCKCSFTGKKRVAKLVTKYTTETRYREVPC